MLDVVEDTMSLVEFLTSKGLQSSEGDKSHKDVMYKYREDLKAIIVSCCFP